MAANRKSGFKPRPSAKRKERAAQVVEMLEKSYPEAKCSLSFDSPLQLLISTMLSAQCTDARVNKVTPALFGRFPDAKSLAGASLDELEEIIKSTGFYRNKAKAIKEASQDIAQKYDGMVPESLDELTALRGVGRKTANVVLGNAFGIPGMVVDTHVGRIARRLDLTKEKDPVKVEFDLMAVVPRENWVDLTHRLIQHGRQYCKAPRPRCDGCPLDNVCQSGEKNISKT